MPVSLRRAGDTWQSRKSAGGLATAMKPILTSSKGRWIGWTGEATSLADPRRSEIVDSWKKKHRYFGVDLDSQVAHGFYEGIANGALWPLLHHFPSLLRFDSADWQAYVKANEAFRDEVLRHLEPNDLIWVHDYHLLLLPQLLREAAPDAAIGFFLHVPFPSSSVFRILPKREEVLRGMLGADYLAFHTHRYLQNFRTSILRLLGLSSRMDSLEVGRRTVKLDALPIGIAPGEFSDLLLKNENTKRHLTELKQQFQYRKIILGVDRLDYTKGIIERLRAYRRFLQEFPEWRGKVVLIQVAVPSRERVPRYSRLRKELDELIGEINGDWSTPNWSPITYVRRGLPQSELAALYAAADVALVTPLRDGLNLVAKEYVACKSSGDGVLILSEFAGAAAEMGEALLVNPYDEEGLSRTIERALTLGEAESRERMLALYRRVHKNNVFAWGKRFTENLASAAKARTEQLGDEPTPLKVDEFVQAFVTARSRHLLLDYDGTLAPYAPLPQEAAPTPALITLLKHLAKDHSSTIAVVSGRSRTDLERWLGGIPNIWLAAEHGALLRGPHAINWEVVHPDISDEWKKRVYPVLEHFIDRTPGSFIEEKEYSLVWHYRMSDPEFGDWLANDLVANLEQMLADSPVKAVKGQKTVEVKSLWADKGQVYSRLAAGSEPDFILAAGDDATDEDLFAQLPASAWTIHVGRDRSRARYYVEGPNEMVQLLERLVESLDVIQPPNSLMTNTEKVVDVPLVPGFASLLQTTKRGPER
ncbi:MAG TPA: bifunctional alpha,alpha-trehalose-phosphate synthase (UDP-forming)/trehalose-phosphatase [Pyrinomonadaceae bacterium]|nr:bifunctional alpha,alpha-trehalose-phosphate synthase (UDP-forming)/trehalose-phosphatase [Pyrinomonadaceae bacterium]